ncbi:helix-turn-helix domain-containing protein [Nocardia sp. NBC_01730]|uniref:helix-turn-helix domain-containing protein n=1 Tax=Nocardia sp. NBC_01730 TaxID=2975998 RepID=UPI002E1345FD|nr:helix-turn-helix domain-containing protein [Nocardia sp. NBC_01730]
MAALESVSTAVLRRHIGRQLTRLREDAEVPDESGRVRRLTPETAAKAVGLGRSTLIRMEDGAEGVKFQEPIVKALLELYGASDEDRSLMLALTAETRNGRKKAWWHDYTETDIPDWFGLYVMLEDSAESIRQYESDLIPGLLQIEEYAESLARTPAGYVSDDRIAARVKVRMDRQGLLSRVDAPRFDVILDESVIRRPFGQPGIFRRQLQHLLTIASQNRASIRILPWSAGMHAGMVAGAFTLLGFPRDPQGVPLEPPVAYMDTLTGALYLHKPEEVDAYELVWRDLNETALSTTESKELITSAMEGLPE